ncbi:Seipin [Carex littledalei]|uniref:Seipin n=1 Tax=Carex littledalei TaxID=544730 RepID=A0A833QN81_9POAL|nr:Seipin [Carex littledalei]
METKSSVSSSASNSDSDPDSDSDFDSFFDALDFLEDTEPFEPIDNPVSDTGGTSPTATINPLPVLPETVSDSEITIEAEPQARSTAVINLPSPPPPPHAPSLEFIVNFIIKAIFFQFSLIVSSITFPIWLLHCSVTLLMDPFGFIKRLRKYISVKVSLILKKIGDKLGMNKAGMVVRLFRGSFWAIYVCVVLMGMFLGAFLGGGLVVRKIVEKPVQIKEELIFDYTKPSPEALVPISSCTGVLNFHKKWGGTRIKGVPSAESSHTLWGGTRVIPANHKFELTVLLNLPESDYNRRLGVFQVRAEFLSSDGKIIYTTSQPCMLRFKSSHMHLLETFIKTWPLVTGYVSEAQIIKIKLKGLKEGMDPTACIRLILEQRAEFKPGAGIPEIYSASLSLESDLPLLKKIIWSWRWTIFVWISAGIFVFELLVALLCCKSVVVPQTVRLATGPTRQV